MVRCTQKGKKLPFLTLQIVHVKVTRNLSGKLASKSLGSYRRVLAESAADSCKMKFLHLLSWSCQGLLHCESQKTTLIPDKIKVITFSFSSHNKTAHFAGKDREKMYELGSA